VSPRLLKGEEALFAKSASSFLLPFSHHASQIAFCSRSATAAMLAEGKLAVRGAAEDRPHP